jgi:hypothetical protein
VTIIHLKVLIVSKEGGTCKNVKKRDELAMESERVKDAKNEAGADEWTEADGADLTRRQNDNVAVKHAAIGRAKQ